MSTALSARVASLLSRFVTAPASKNAESALVDQARKLVDEDVERGGAGAVSGEVVRTGWEMCLSGKMGALLALPAPARRICIPDSSSSLDAFDRCDSRSIDCTGSSTSLSLLPLLLPLSPISLPLLLTLLSSVSRPSPPAPAYALQSLALDLLLLFVEEGWISTEAREALDRLVGVVERGLEFGRLRYVEFCLCSSAFAPKPCEEMLIKGKLPLTGSRRPSCCASSSAVTTSSTTASSFCESCSPPPSIFIRQFTDFYRGSHDLLARLPSPPPASLYRLLETYRSFEPERVYQGIAQRRTADSAGRKKERKELEDVRERVRALQEGTEGGGEPRVRPKSHAIDVAWQSPAHAPFHLRSWATGETAQGRGSDQDEASVAHDLLDRPRASSLSPVSHSSSHTAHVLLVQPSPTTVPLSDIRTLPSFASQIEELALPSQAASVLRSVSGSTKRVRVLPEENGEEVRVRSWCVVLRGGYENDRALPFRVLFCVAR